MSEQDKVDYWKSLAEYDLITARVMLDNGRYLYVGFMCHQAIEKILKAFHVFKKKDNPPYIHSLLQLARGADLYEEIIEETYRDTIDILDPLNIEARYPSQKDEIMKSLNQARCGDIFNRTKELYEWIAKKLWP